MKKNRILAAAAAAAFAALAPLQAHADLTIGVSISLTGPTSALGIPSKAGIALWPIGKMIVPADQMPTR